MPRFFINQPVTDTFSITGEDALHITKSLRMKIGETLVLCHDKVDYICKINSFSKTSVSVTLLETKPCEAEPPVTLTLFQCLPKGDKMDLIVQKAVEIGVCKIVPVLSLRCVSRPNEASLAKKISRWQKIAREAAMQSGRGLIPTVAAPVNLEQALSLASCCEKIFSFYENSNSPIFSLTESISSAAIFIGPEGGFDPAEINLFSCSAASICSLGKRILRTETAAIVASALVIFGAEADNKGGRRSQQT